MKRNTRGVPFAVNVWPPMVDAVTLVLAAFVMLMLLGGLAQREALKRLQQREAQLARVEAEKTRLQQRLQTLASVGALDLEDDKVILQGEVLFDSGSDALTADGSAFLARLAPPLATLLKAEPEQMVMVGGHTDDIPIHNARFDSNWDLSVARAVAVARMLTDNGVPAHQILASGFGSHHPRVPNQDDASRKHNRRIEVLLVPIRSVTTR